MTPNTLTPEAQEILDLREVAAAKAAAGMLAGYFSISSIKALLNTLDGVEQECTTLRELAEYRLTEWHHTCKRATSLEQSLAETQVALFDACVKWAKDTARASTAEEEVGRLREVLEFYADPYEQLDQHGYPVPVPDFYSELDFGERAVEALKGSAVVLAFTGPAPHGALQAESSEGANADSGPMAAETARPEIVAESRHPESLRSPVATKEGA